MALGIFKSSFVTVFWFGLGWVDGIDPPVSFHPRIRQLESRDELLENFKNSKFSFAFPVAIS